MKETDSTEYVLCDSIIHMNPYEQRKQYRGKRQISGCRRLGLEWVLIANGTGTFGLTEVF